MAEETQVHEHTSVFCVIPWADPQLGDGLFFLMVHNREDDKDGKPGGIGMAGGGQHPGETPGETAARELYGEVGLAAGTIPTREVFRRTSYRARDPRTNRVRYASSLKGLSPSSVEEVSQGTKVAMLVPQESLLPEGAERLRGFLRLAAKSSQDEEGVVVRLSEAEANNLGIQEIEEIDGIGLISASKIGQIADREAELLPYERRFYLSHLGILRAYMRSNGLEES